VLCPPNAFQPPESTRLLELLKYIDDQFDSTACFQDVRGFVERLAAGELSHLLFDLLPQSTNSARGYKAFALRTLTCKLRYMATSLPQFEALQPKNVTDVLAEVTTDALNNYHELERTLPDEDEIARSQQDFLADLAMVAAMGFIRMSGMSADKNAIGSKCNRHLLLAAAILEHQLSRTAKHSGILLLLVRLYLRIGAATRAAALWELLEVKRTIVDSLSPIFFDRISGVNPGLASSPMLSGVVQSHYVNSLRLRMPRRLTDAFQEEAYTSILEIPKYINNLRTSCTMAMGYLEERRALRAMGVVPPGLDGTALG
jgi:N-terminal acetyltransferase B complex non-catalytic subunit